MKARTCVLLPFCLLITTFAFAGPKGTISVKNFEPGSITVDGDISDWPLDQYTRLAQQPLFPEGQGVGVPTDALGDFIAWDIERAGPFNGTIYEDWDPESPSEFGSSIYLGFDNSFLYVLGVFIDDELRGDRDDTGFANFLNDGFEFFIDALNDSVDDNVSEIGHPSFDEEEPNLDDFQLTVALNDFFEPDVLGPNEIGAKQHLERAGEFDIIKVGYDEELEATDLSSVGGKNIAARTYNDLRAAGATNPEIVANPNTQFSGYALEAVIPFGIVDGFTPDHDMGFDLFWRDVDDEAEPGFGGGEIFWSDWAQNIEVTGAGLDGNLFHGGNWGTITFEGLATPLQAGDSDEDLDFDQLDLVSVQIAAKYLTGGAATWGEGDWDGAPGGQQGSPPAGDGLFNQRDIIAALAAGTYLTGPYGAIGGGGSQGDDQTSLVYTAGTGELSVDAPAGKELTSINITSAAGLFQGDKPAALDGAFDNFAADNVFKATFGGSFGSISFGTVLAADLTQDQLLNDLSAVGSLAGGGDLGEVDLVYIPEPSTFALICLSLLGLRWRRAKVDTR